MTEQQIRLLRGEVQRHVALALASHEPAIHSDHMEVAAALSAAIQESEEKTCRKQSTPRRLWRWATRTGSDLLHLPARAREGSGRESAR